MADNTIEQIFEQTWAIREESVYPRLLGKLSPTISNIPPEFFTGHPHHMDPPALWLHYGIIESPPDEMRDCWAYLSSGLSNPTPDQCANPKISEPSGIGFEVLMFTAERSPWAQKVMQWVMANQLLTAAGRTDFDLIEIFDRISLPPALRPPPPSAMEYLFVVPAPADIQQFELPTGRVENLLLLAITAAEMKFARAQEGGGLLEVLRHHGVSRITDPTRASTV